MNLEALQNTLRSQAIRFNDTFSYMTTESVRRVALNLFSHMVCIGSAVALTAIAAFFAAVVIVPIVSLAVPVMATCVAIYLLLCVVVFAFKEVYAHTSSFVARHVQPIFLPAQQVI